MTTRHPTRIARAAHAGKFASYRHDIHEREGVDLARELEDEPGPPPDRLCPGALSDFGLRASLQILVHEFAQRAQVEVDAELGTTALGAAAQLAVYRLVQEALTNIARHAAATRAEVALHCRAGEAIVSVHDNGVGFDPALLVTVDRGLADMRHCVQDCGGRFAVASSAGHGTCISAVLPGCGAPAASAAGRPSCSRTAPADATHRRPQSRRRSHG